MEALTFVGVVEAIKNLFTGAIGMAGTAGETVTNTPLLLCFVLVPLVGLGVGLFKRLVNIR